MARQWILNGQKGFETSLEYQESIKAPLAEDLSPNEVLVKMHAASLNHREIMVASPGVCCHNIPSYFPANLPAFLPEHNGTDPTSSDTWM